MKNRICTGIWKWTRRGIAARSAAAALALGACTAIDPTAPLDHAQLNLLLQSRGLDPAEVILPYRLSEEMRRWAHETVPRELPPAARLELLIERLLDKDELSLQYTWGRTGTAIDVFEDRRANCLAFTNLFVGMAREVGVPVSFLAVEDVETYRREGDLVVISDHVAVGYDTGPDQLLYDFSERPNERVGRVRKISDLTAIAMFYSNRGAEALQGGEVGEALRWLRPAVVLDPQLAHAWVNLGVALRRAGQPRSAEEAYLQALELDANTASAYQNLASLLRLEGRDAEAAAYEAALAKAATRNPYAYLALGDISRQAGRLAEAKRFYRRAILLGEDDAESYAAMGQLALATGDQRLARKMLRKAQQLDIANQRTALLAQLLDRRRPS